jgi:hypothetical protein
MPCITARSASLSASASGPSPGSVGPSSGSASPASGPAALAASAAALSSRSAWARSSAFDGWTIVEGNQGSAPHSTGGSPSSSRARLIDHVPFLIFMSTILTRAVSSASTGSSKATKSRGSTRRAILVRAAAIVMQRGRTAFFWCW